MANLSTTYAGLNLRNPFIIGSSGITSSLDKIRKLDSLGAGAIVLKSLFEEQIRHEAGRNLEGSDYPEAHDYVKAYTRENSVSEYLELIRDAKRAISIPVIASINCVSASEWMDFAVKIEEAGADALELNVFYLPVDKDKSSADYEKIYCDILEAMRGKIKIPLIIKLGYHFTNLTHLVNQIYFRKADSVVLFNRFYEPDINISDMKIISSEVFSSPADIRNSLRWVGIISSSIPQIDIAASTGIHSGDAAVKQILAGARAVQLCSVLYKNGIEFLPKIIDRFESWMIEHNYKSVNEFRGKLNYGNVGDPAVYERAQFMKYFSSQS
ncbi:MAG: dihydroorotate dehydrogenase-like protein [Bacteroidales bacterium]|nr:dihydroorotate dehydrogenase-like protein [Bacteroidales bacterium]MCB9000008.1 dihydroorotate dehydrogenase-like protein [Bacteroidales bacterium]MCB9013262.1 dihydroorotate dehydrogenase-like protein [Bacteroidales bacterium]